MTSKGRVSEIFHSVQGEGLYLGEEQLFVRFFGCNLNCAFCDTHLNVFIEYSPQDLFEEIELYNGTFQSISFTGGEPLLQAEFLEETLRLLSKESHRIYLETNGTLPGELQKVIKYVDVVAMDIKLPSSTKSGAFWNFHGKFLELASQKEVFVKMIICNSTEDNDLREAMKLIKQVNKSTIIILQPNSFEQNGLKEKLQLYKEMCRREKLTACVIPQIHRMLGVR